MRGHKSKFGISFEQRRRGVGNRQRSVIDKKMFSKLQAFSNKNLKERGVYGDDDEDDDNEG